MADRKSSYDIIFGAKNNTGGILARVAADFALLKKGGQETAKSLSRLADGVGDVAGKAALIGGALVAAFGIAGAAALKFNDDVNFAVGKTLVSLNQLPEEAERFEKLIKDVYGTALPETIEESADLITKAFQKFGDASDEELTRISENALVLRKVFDADLGESINSANALVKNFGISSDEAFDFIAGGFQKGLNSSGDFLDSIQEYSTQFKDGGATAGEFFSVLQTGLAEGVLGTDKAADAFKEFRLRVLDDTKATREALTALGIDADKNFAELSKGTKTVSQSFQEVIDAVGKVSDPVKRQTLLVGLLGTQFEDLGAQAFTAIDTTATKMSDLSGAIDKTKDGALSLTDEFVKAFRAITNAITDLPFLDALSDKISFQLERVTEEFKKSFAKLNFAEFEKQLLDFIEAIANDIRNVFGDVDLTSAEGLRSIMQQIVDAIALILQGGVKVADTLVPAFKLFGDIIRDLNKETSSVSDVFKIIGGITDALVGAVQAAGAAFLAFATTAVNAFAGLVQAVSFLPGKVFPQVEELREKLGKVQDGLKGFRSELLESAGEGFKQSMAGAGAAVDAFGGEVEEVKEKVKEIPKDIEALTAKPVVLKVETKIEKQSIIETKKEIEEERGVSDDVKELQIKIKGIELDKEAQNFVSNIEEIDDKLRTLTDRKNEIELIAQFKTAKGEVTPNELALEFDGINKQIEDLTGKKKAIDIELKDNQSFQKLSNAKDELDTLTETDRIVRLKTEVDEGKGFGKLVDEIQVLEDGSYKITINPELDNTGVKEVEEEIDKLTEDKKLLLELEKTKIVEETKQVTTRIQEQSKIISEAMKFKFELKFQDKELAFKKLDTAVKSSTSLIIAMTDANADLFGSFDKDFDLETMSLFRQQLSQNLRIQEEQAAIQKEILEQTLEEIRLKNQLKQDFMNGDQAMLRITIDDKLGPTLTAFVKEFIPLMQLWGEENDYSPLIEAGV
jgi:phage-related minor tail protein